MSESPSVNIPYPWQQPQWLRIQQQAAQGKIPHAILLAGQKGIGKWHFAEALADYLLCDTPKADLACGQCRSCQLLLAGTHPDKQAFIPEDAEKAIKIDQIRQLSTFVNKTAQQGGRKVVLLGPVEQLNINAANALLKNLEEPAGDTVMLLVSHVSSAVMATIRSRCQLLPMMAPARQEAVTWLNELKIDGADALLDLAGGAPLVAREMAEGDYLQQLELFITTLDEFSKQQQGIPDITPAKEWLSLSLGQITEWWLQVIHGIIKQQSVTLTSTTDGGETSTIAAAMSRVISTGKQFNQQWLFKFSDKLVQLRQQHLHGANPNMQLLLEELMMDWQVIVQRS